MSVSLKNISFLNKYYCVRLYLLIYRSLTTYNGMTYIKEMMYVHKRFGELCCLHLQVRPWRREVLCQKCYPPTRLHGITTQKT